MIDTKDWWQDHDERLSFARTLAESHLLTTVADTLYYFEKPWKWTTEHERWVQAGRPETVPEDE